MKSIGRVGVLFTIFFGVSIWAASNEPSCESYFRMPKSIRVNVRSTQEALTTLSAALPNIFPMEQLQERPWYQLLENFALPSIRSRSPLLVSTFIGGGNAGKSTLFNALPALIAEEPERRLHEPISKTGYFPGLTRRMVIALAPTKSDIVEGDLQERFGRLQKWTSPEDGQKVGPGLLANISEIPKNLAFVDSPDFDTGEIRSDQPDNLQRALRVVGPSDVLILMFNPQTVRNQANAKVLAKIFNSYGLKRSILVFWCDPSMPLLEANELLTKMARSIYESAGGEPLEGVLGAYMMPYSSDVPGGLAHPELRPLGNTPPFPTLVRMMSAESAGLKKYSIEHASRTIEGQVSHDIREKVKSLMAEDLYRMGLAAVTDEVSRDSLEDFPYLNLRDEIRRRFAQMSNGVSQLIQGLGGWISVPEAKVANLLQKISGRSHRFTEQLEVGHVLHDKIAISQLVLQLQKGELIFDMDRATDAPELKRLVRMSRHFFEIFPEERRKARSSDHFGKVVVWLPRPELLGHNSQKAFDTLLKSDTAQLTDQLSQRLNAAQFDNALSDPTRREINRALGRIQQNQSPLRRGLRFSADVATLAAPAAAALELAHMGFNSTLLTLAAVNLSARPFHMISERMRDRFLRRRLNEWFHQMQYRTTMDFLRQSVTQNLSEALEPQREIDSQIEAIQKAQRALKFMNPDYQVIQVPD